MSVSVGNNTNIEELAILNMNITIQTFRRKVSRYCINYFQEGVQEYIRRLPDKRTAWLAITARLAHRIDYEYTRYGVTETNWDKEL